MNQEKKPTQWRKSPEYRDRVQQSFRKAMVYLYEICRNTPYRPRQGFTEVFSTCGLSRSAIRSFLPALEKMNVVKRYGTNQGMRVLWCLRDMTPNDVEFDTMCHEVYTMYIHDNFSWKLPTKLSDFSDEEIKNEALRRGLLNN